MTQRLEDKIALITGASSGIGRAIARRFAEEGATIVIADIREEPREGGTPTHEQLIGDGHDATFVKTDVASVVDVDRAINTCVDTYGRLDILVNNAGIFPPQTDITGVDESTYDRVIDVNLKGVYFAAQSAIEVMQDQADGGVIVNMSSIAGLAGYDQSSVYCASKGGVANLTRELAVEQGPNGIRVNALNPGIIKTTQTLEDEQDVIGKFTDAIPLRRDGAPDDVARAAVFLASDDAAYITGHNLVVDGGYMAD